MKNDHSFIRILPISFGLLLFGFAAFGQDLKTKQKEDTQEPIALTKNLFVTNITLNTWFWTAYKNPEGKPPAINGLLHLTDSMVIGVNIPWRPQQVDQLAKFCLEKLQRRIGKVILTSFSPQRTQAMEAFKSHAVVFHGTLNNRTLSGLRNMPSPDQFFSKKQDIEIDGRLIQLYNIGPILAKDQVIVFFPDDKILYLGPLIKTPHAKLTGLSKNTLDRWEKALHKSQRLYPGSEYIIPARGPIRDQRAIAQTYILIRKTGKNL